jgi:hypothetical protein
MGRLAWKKEVLLVLVIAPDPQIILGTLPTLMIWAMNPSRGNTDFGMTLMMKRPIPIGIPLDGEKLRKGFTERKMETHLLREQHHH